MRESESMTPKKVPAATRLTVLHGAAHGSLLRRRLHPWDPDNTAVVAVHNALDIPKDPITTGILMRRGRSLSLEPQWSERRGPTRALYVGPKSLETLEKNFRPILRAASLPILRSW